MAFLLLVTASLSRNLIFDLPRDDSPAFNQRVEVPDPEARMTTVELVASRGYPVQVHRVRTRDGYLLELHRIPFGVSGGPKPNEGPVFLQHGLLSSSADFVINFGNQSLGYMLADAGYDVWMGNFRGNRYSRRHVSLDPDRDRHFWDFSWDEMAAEDLPAMVDYVLSVTGREDLAYVGHSMGTTTFFALASADPGFREKVHVMVGLGPVGTIANSTSPLKYLAPFVDEVEYLTSLFGVGEFLPSGALTDFLARFVCDPPWPRPICENVIFLICGFDEKQLNASRLGVYVSHDPAGTSSRTLLHYLQMMRSGKFCRYDFGAEGNRKRYDQDTPPEFNLTAVEVPVALVYGDNDRLADPEDVRRLASALPNLVSKYRVPYAEWAHLDFLWGVDAERLQNEHVLRTLRSGGGARRPRGPTSSACPSSSG